MVALCFVRKSAASETSRLVSTAPANLTQFSSLTSSLTSCSEIYEYEL